MNRRGTSLAEGVQMAPRLILVCIIALIVLGGSNILYSLYINVRTAEAMIMNRQIVDCLAPKGVVDVDLQKYNREILENCRISGGRMERFFINVSVLDSGGNEISKLYDGDSGAIWIKKLFNKVSGESLQSLKINEPGVFIKDYNVILSDNRKGKLIVGVFVKDER